MVAPYLNAPISAVCVFAPGVSCARVTRSGDLSALSDKPAQIRIGGLPLALDDDSLRLRVDGDAAVATGATIIYEVPPADPALAPAEDGELLAAAQALEVARGRLECIAEREKALASLQVVKRPQQRRGEAPVPPPVAARLDIAALHREESLRLAKEKLRLSEELRLAEEHYADLALKARQRSSARRARKQELRKTALITLRWEGAPAGQLHLEYQVPGALWAPRYAIRFDPAMARARVHLAASVCQKTGEDWTGVRLTLSTADPLAWHDLPVLDSIRLGRQQAPARASWRPSPAVADELFAGFDQIGRKQPIVASAIAAEPAAAGAPVVLAAPAASPEVLADMAADADDLAGPDETQLPAAGAAPIAASPPARSNRERAMAKRAAAGGTMDRTVDRLRDSYRGSMDLGAMSEIADVHHAEVVGSLIHTTDPSLPSAPSRDLMNFGNLVLPPADDPARGKLREATDVDRTQWLLAMQSITVTVEIKQVVATAVSQAYSLKGAEPPDGCVLPAASRFAYAYSADLPATVASDGVWQNVSLTSAEGKAELRHVVVPRESSDVFRQAVLDNPFDAPLLDGPADLYLGDAFLLRASIHQTAPGGQVRLGLGVEQGITVARNTSFVESSSGVFGGGLALDHQVRCTIANKLHRPVNVEVRERLPVAAEGEEDCKVKLSEVSPPWQPWVPEDGRPLKGGYAWRVQLAPGAREELKLSYSIAIPSKNEIAGGNRREN